MCAPANEIMIDIYQIALFAVEPSNASTAKAIFDYYCSKNPLRYCYAGGHTCSKKALCLEFPKGNIHGAHLRKRYI